MQPKAHRARGLRRLVACTAEFWEASSWFAGFTARARSGVVAPSFWRFFTLNRDFAGVAPTTDVGASVPLVATLNLGFGLRMRLDTFSFPRRGLSGTDGAGIDDWERLDALTVGESRERMGSNLSTGDKVAGSFGLATSTARDMFVIPTAADILLVHTSALHILRLPVVFVVQLLTSN